MEEFSNLEVPRIHEVPNNYVCLGTLEGMNSANANSMNIRFCESELFQLTLNERNLTAIRGDNADLNS